MGGITRKRIWTSLFVVPPLFFLIAVGPPIILFLIVLTAMFFGLREFYALALPQSKTTERIVGIGLGLALAVMIFFADIDMPSAYLVLLLLLLSLLFMITSQDLSSAVSKMGVTLFGILYIAFLLSHISLIRNMDSGNRWTLFLIATVWGGDIFAFVIGSQIGKHKLYPKISPKKTVEGLAGAILGSVLIGLLFKALFLPQLGPGICVMLGVGMGFLGQLGDFSESMLKRSAQVKDSGSLLPGHGGILDRLDSFLFAAPFLYHALLHLVKETP
jgi:phosphatidate cytidylyltransferase